MSDWLADKTDAELAAMLAPDSRSFLIAIATAEHKVSVPANIYVGNDWWVLSKRPRKDGTWGISREGRRVQRYLRKNHS